MMTAYLDVSRGAEPVYTLAGYIARTHEWNAFRRKWQALLASEGVSVFIPADLDLKRDGQRIGTYKDWSDDRVLNFQKRAYEIIRKYRRVAISSTVVTRDFKLHFGWTRKRDGTPRFYLHTTQDLLANVGDWVADHKIKDPIFYVFETGDDGYYEVEAILSKILRGSDPEYRMVRERCHMSGFTRSNKKCAIQLQAAGVWAYESYKQVANRIVDGPKRDVRESWKALFRKYDEPYNSYWDKDNLAVFVRRYQQLGGEIGPLL